VGVMGLASRFEGAQHRDPRICAVRRSAGPGVRGHIIPSADPAQDHCGPSAAGGDAAGFADPFHGRACPRHPVRRPGSGCPLSAGSQDKGTRSPGMRANATALIVRQLRVALQMAKMLVCYPGVLRELFFSDTRALDRFLDIPLGRAICPLPAVAPPAAAPRALSPSSIPDAPADCAATCYPGSTAKHRRVDGLAAARPGTCPAS